MIAAIVTNLLEKHEYHFGEVIRESEMNDGVVEVLGHGCACTEFGSVFDDQLASRGILVFKITGVSLRKQKDTYSL